MYRGITSKKPLNNWFFVFFGFWQEKPVFLHESFWQGCQNYFRRVQWNTYRAKFSNESLENSRIFEYVLKFSAQWRKTFFGVGKTAIDVRGKSLWNFFFKREKFAIFSDSERMFTSREKFCQSCETRNERLRGSFRGKNIFWNVYNLSHFFGLWSNKRLAGKKIFSRVVTTAIRASRYIIWEKVIFIQKKVLIVLLFWSLSIFFLSIDKK